MIVFDFLKIVIPQKIRPILPQFFFVRRKALWYLKLAFRKVGKLKYDLLLGFCVTICNGSSVKSTNIFKAHGHQGIIDCRFKWALIAHITINSLTWFIFIKVLRQNYNGMITVKILFPNINMINKYTEISNLCYLQFGTAFPIKHCWWSVLGYRKRGYGERSC